MRTLTFIALLSLVAAGCGMGSAANEDASPSGGSAGMSGTSGDFPTSISFPMSPVTVDLGAQVEISVQTTPPGAYRVRFSLLTTGGDPRDAILSKSEVETSAVTGGASVLLTAPNSPAAFELRASVDNKVSAKLSVTAVEPQTATVIANPVRLGFRQPKTWVATVHEGKKCSDVPGVPPLDGTHIAFADSRSAVELQGVRTGIELAIVLRSGYFMGGCASVDMLPPEAAATPRVVDVQVLDRPMDLAASDVTLTLGVANPEATWGALLSSTQAKALDALDGFPDKARTDVETLLAAMRDGLSGSARDSFSSARSSEGWDALVQARWASSTKLTDLVSAWLTAGKAALLVSEDVFTGRLTPNATTGKPDDADLSFDEIVGIPAAEAGFVSPADVSWSAGPDDTVVLSTHLYFFGSTLLTRLAESHVRASYAGVSSVPSALASTLDCSALGAELAAAGSDPQLAFAGCNGDCLSALCESALETIWERARKATAVTPVDIEVAATGEGWVGDAAQLAGIKGNWVGQLSAGDGAAPTTTGGLLEAAEPPLDAP